MQPQVFSFYLATVLIYKPRPLSCVRLPHWLVRIRGRRVTAGCLVAAAAHFSTCWRHSHVDRPHIKRSSIQHDSKTTADSGNVAVTPCSGHLDSSGCLNQKRAGNVVVFTSEYQKLRFYLFDYKHFVLFVCFLFF